jgi:hypothetical protein
VQSFETDTLARDYAALLALFYFQKTLPLERKLPEPFCTTWIEMINASKPAPTQSAGKTPAASAKPPATKAETSAPAPVIIPVKETVKEPAKIVSQEADSNKQKGKTGKDLQSVKDDAANAQWLCDNCGNANFATTAAGLPRTKCFKCQTPKPEKCSTVSKANTADAKKMKAPPKAVLDLRAQSTHASVAEIERKELEERAAKNRRLTYFDALKRANRPKAIHLKPAIREQLEKLFGIEHTSDYITNIRGLEEYLEDIVEEGIIPLDICSVSYSEQAQIFQSICVEFSDKGCSDNAIVQSAKNAIFKRNDELVEDFAVRYESIQVDNVSVVEKSRLVLETLLRETLDSSVFEKISVVAPSSLATSSSTKMNQVGDELGFPEAVIEVLESLGWRQDSALLTTLQLVKQQALLSKLLDDALEYYLPILVHSLALVTAVDKKLPCVRFFHQIQRGEKSSCSALDEENETMASILGDTFHCYENIINGKKFVNVCISNVSLQDSLKFQHCVDLEFIFHENLNYPDGDVPLILLKNSSKDRRTDSRLIALNILAQQLVNQSSGAMVMFEVYSMIMDFNDNNRLFDILNSLRFSKDVSEAFLALYDDEIEVSEELIAATLFEVQPKAQDDVDLEQDSSISDMTEIESISTDATPSLSGKHNNRSRLHPFWSKAQNGRTCTGFDLKNHQYVEMLRTREALPSCVMKNEFLSLLPTNRVIIVTGETGCG